MPLTLKQHAYQVIRDKLMDGSLGPGARLSDEALAREIGISRSPVREAMHILERYRLVELNPRRGARVTEINEQYVGWLFDIMIDLVCLTTRLCTENRTPEELKQLIDQEKQAAAFAGENDSAGYLNAFSECSLTVLKATGNPLLEQLMGDWLPCLRRIYFLFLSHSTYNLQESAAMLQGAARQISKGNPDAASKTLESHGRKEKKRVLEIIRSHAAPDQGEPGTQHVSNLP